MMRVSKIHPIRCAAGFAAAFAVLLILAMPARAADPTYPAGSRIGLVPPHGMELSTRFAGFEDAERKTAIILATFPGDAFEQLDKSMTPETLKKQGFDIEGREPFEAKAGKGFLLVGRQMLDQTPIRKYMFVAPAGDITAIATVQTPEHENFYADADVRAALATLTARTNIPDAERMSLVPFTVGNLAGFRIDDVLPGRAMMLIDTPAQGSSDKPADPSKHETNARFLIAAQQGGPDQFKDHDSFARETFNQIGGIVNVRVVDAEPLRIAGQSGYETLANAKDPENGDDLKVVQWLRFGSGGYLQMVGVARAALWGDMFTRMRTVRDSIDAK
jgi:hypothetical protein